MANPVCELLRCELPIQLAPMGSVAATPSLPLAVAAAGGHGMYPALALPPAAIAPVVDALAACGLPGHDGLAVGDAQQDPVAAVVDLHAHEVALHVHRRG